MTAIEIASLREVLLAINQIAAARIDGLNIKIASMRESERASATESQEIEEIEAARRQFAKNWSTVWSADRPTAVAATLCISAAMIVVANLDDTPGSKAALKATLSQAQSERGKKGRAKQLLSVEAEKVTWQNHARILAKQARREFPRHSISKLASEVEGAWKMEHPPAPSHRTLETFISAEIKARRIPATSGVSAKKRATKPA